MAAPSHNAYTNSASYRRNFDRDLYADSLIVNRGLIHTLKVDHLVTTGPVCFPDGSAAAPSITFCDNLNTGFFSSSVNVIDATTNGAPAMRINGDGDVIIIKAAGQLLVPDGTEALPSIAFSAEPGSGLYRSGGGLPSISDGGVVVAEFQTNGTLANVFMGNGATTTDVTVRIGGNAASRDIELNLASVAASGSVHINANQIAMAAPVGTNGFVGVLALGSSDTAGTLTITEVNMAAGTVPVVFNTPFANAPFVILSPLDANAVTFQNLATWAVTTTVAGFTVAFTGTGAVSGAFNYHVIGRE